MCWTAARGVRMFPVAAAIDHHKLHGVKQHTFTAPWRCQSGWAAPGWQGSVCTQGREAAVQALPAVCLSSEPSPSWSLAGMQALALQQRSPCPRDGPQIPVPPHAAFKPARSRRFLLKLLISLNLPPASGWAEPPALIRPVRLAKAVWIIPPRQPPGPYDMTQSRGCGLLPGTGSGDQAVAPWGPS